MGWTVVIIVSIVAACPAGAQEIFFLGGAMQDTETNDRSYSWQIEYREGLAEHFAYSLSYLNEGHTPNHHRDGHSVQIWTRANVFDRRLSLAAGFGPFYFFDTMAAPAGTSHYNDHGWGGILSFAATWHGESRWLVQLRTNVIETSESIDTVSAVFGVGYQLEAPLSAAPLTQPTPRRRRTMNNEMTVFFGRTIVNSFGSEPADAGSIEYRRCLRPSVEWTITWLYEGKNSVIARNGLITQLWAAKAFLEDDRLALGIGFGPYHGIDRYRDPHSSSAHDRFLSGVLTLTGSYGFHPHWGIRISWNRTITDYNRDTDVILAGIGYRF
ncbi:MAG: hypothetical protein ACM3MD_00395 [Betaproteobacteria bacterium]